MAATLAFLTSATAALAEGGSARRDLTELSLEELLDVEISVASAKPKPARETPAVVTVVTRDEIRDSGARDLIDVLRLVSGFEFGVDIWGVVGVGFRGLWGHEGKILLSVDGLAMNEPMYGNLTFGNHVPVDEIERVEIVRGPGSVIHGNFAELAVVNVVTKIGDEVTGVSGALVAGVSEGARMRTNLDASWGTPLGTDGYFGASAFVADAERSAATYTDVYGSSYDMDGNSDLRTGSAGLVYRRGGFRARLLYDTYRTEHRDAYDAILPAPVGADWNSLLASASWRVPLGERLQLAPKIRAKMQEPWRSRDVPTDDYMYYDPTATQVDVGLQVSGDLNPSVGFLAGAQYVRDAARYGAEGPYVFPDGTRSTAFSRFALFTEWAFETPVAGVTAGVRYENPSDYDAKVVPRVGVTKSFGAQHVKLIYNRAFRAPSIEQISFGDDVQTEIADVAEAEWGRTFGATGYLGVNAFEISLHRPIAYVWDSEANVDTYRNTEGMGTRGLEIEGRLQKPWGRLTARYSYYRARGEGPGIYSVPGRDDVFLAFPAHKATVDGSFRLTTRFRLNPSAVVVSERWGHDHVDPETGEGIVSRFGPEAIVNLGVLWRDAFAQGLEVSLTAFDLFGAGHSFAQPYDGLHAPLPGPGREFLLRLRYQTGR